MPFQFTGVKGSAGSASTNNLAVVLPGTSPGSLILVGTTAWTSGSQASFVAVADDVNPGFYTQVAFAAPAAPNDQALALHYLPNNLGGTLTIVSDPSGNTGDAQQMFVVAAEFIGGLAAPLLSSIVTAGGPNADATTGRIVPTTPDNLIVAFLCSDTGGQIIENARGEGYTLVADDDSDVLSTGEAGSMVFTILQGGVGSPQSHSWRTPSVEVWSSIIAAFGPQVPYAYAGLDYTQFPKDKLARAARGYM